eukprot:CAMPEP_0172697512 /NCGR_PEP_ID=MMETSP1074-20121228/28819_1 /TAXON_ID=2916 /ORGANISM="Ceratium fusus, Strain PA161109" /LENGTH=112 /DNA_ID=CAMNT_0013518435 /DNA_START=67 /DNA_END=407 /DNA_ORIENTATION=+
MVSGMGVKAIVVRGNGYVNQTPWHSMSLHMPPASTAKIELPTMSLHSRLALLSLRKELARASSKAGVVWNTFMSAKSPPLELALETAARSDPNQVMTHVTAARSLANVRKNH